MNERTCKRCGAHPARDHSPYCLLCVERALDAIRASGPSARAIIDDTVPGFVGEDDIDDAEAEAERLADMEHNE